MPKYHFIPSPIEELPRDRAPQSSIVAAYGKYERASWGLFEEAEQVVKGERKFKIKNCEGSLILVDTTLDITKNPLNKLHIGELLIRRPHIESYQHSGETGPRVDLAEFDYHYAVEMHVELKKWRDPEHLAELRKRYDSLTWYCVAHRLKQINISQNGLEEKIAESKRNIFARFRATPEQKAKRTFVSDKAKLIEADVSKVVSLMGHARQCAQTRKKQPTLIINPDIWNLAETIYSNLHEVMEFIRPQVNVEQARRYWDEVDAWEKL